MAQAQTQLAMTGTGPWSTLAFRRFGGTSTRTFTFDQHIVTVEPHQDRFVVSTGDFSTSATYSLLSPTELVSSFPDTRLQCTVIPNGNKLHVFAHSCHYILTQPIAIENTATSTGGSYSLSSPMPATVIDVRVARGDRVQEGQVVCVLESMKMEINIRAGREGVIDEVNVVKGQSVQEGKVLVTLEQQAKSA
jgi:3-methylcrotonyl-CoA carboxylase alpha subunit